MSSQTEKTKFSKRLKQALLDSNHPISPTYLSNEFNNRYDGQAVSVQSANNWLLGKSIPNQDKLSILAIWLNVSNQWLRFGDTASNEFLEYNSKENPDFDYFLKFRSLDTNKKNIIKSLIDEFLHL
ncbi:hypothetical protein D3C78_123720 [compost metagenome]